MLTRDYLLALISEEKELYSKYTQLCSSYNVQPDPIVKAVNQSRLMIFNKILQDCK